MFLFLSVVWICVGVYMCVWFNLISIIISHAVFFLHRIIIHLLLWLGLIFAVIITTITVNIICFRRCSFRPTSFPCGSVWPTPYFPSSSFCMVFHLNSASSIHQYLSMCIFLHGHTGNDVAKAKTRVLSQWCKNNLYSEQLLEVHTQPDIKQKQATRDVSCRVV